MKLERIEDHDQWKVRFILTITGVEWALAKLDDVDTALLRECDGPDATIADRLLALEMLARRIEEAKRPQPPLPAAMLEGPPEEVEAEIVEPS